MKKPAVLPLCLLILAALVVPACADVIWEPYGDTFYEENRADCVYVNAVYEALTDVTIRQSPGASAKSGAIPAGEEVYVGYTWASAAGKDWGYVERDGASGWADLGNMARLYDEACFQREHGGQFTALNEPQALETDAAVVYLWSFPGSGRIRDELDRSIPWLADTPPSYDTLWTDGEGRTWARITYYYGMGGWIYLADPSASDLPATAPRYAGGTDEAPAPTGESGDFPVLPVTLAAAVVLVTAVLLVVLGRKKKA